MVSNSKIVQIRPLDTRDLSARCDLYALKCHMNIIMKCRQGGNRELNRGNDFFITPSLTHLIE